MDKSTHDIKKLWQLYITNEATPEQVKQLYDLVKEEGRDEENQAIIEEYLAQIPFSSSIDSTSKDAVIRYMGKVRPELKMFLRHSEDAKKSTNTVHRVHFLRRGFFRYAAAAILVFGAAAYLWTNKKPPQTIVNNTKPLQTDIAPGNNRAILTLANGQQIILDSTQGNIAKQGSQTLINLAGKLKYEGVGTTDAFNTISTPKGGQYQIVLPDGSRVWLNAASSIKFPTAFTSSTRNVEMTGEAYMEIVKNPKQPFVVKANGVEIQVLGTIFNLNAYADESAIKTTLISGSVNVKVHTAAEPLSSLRADKLDGRAKSSVILKPGQQAVVMSLSQRSVSDSSNVITVSSNINIDQVMAWKNGWFDFNGANLYDVMRQLERWYDIKVKYEGNIHDVVFEGKMDRGVPLSGVLEVFSLDFQIKTKLDGRTLIISENSK